MTGSLLVVLGAVGSLILFVIGALKTDPAL